MKNDLIVGVKVTFAIERETAETAVRILNLYLEDNPDIKPTVTLTHEQSETHIKPYYQVRL